MQHLHPLQVADFLGGKSAEKAAPADGGDEVLGEIGSHLRKAWLGHVYRGDSEKISKHEEEEDTMVPRFGCSSKDGSLLSPAKVVASSSKVDELFASFASGFVGTTVALLLVLLGIN